MRVIGPDGSQLGIMDRDEALAYAESLGQDLIEIAPSANPSVAKVMDWGKYQYQKLKEQQKNRRKSKAGDLKQMRVGLKISENDLDIKLRKVDSFLDDGDKVRITIVFRGREMAHKELGYQMADRIIEKLGDKIIVDQKPQMSGRNLSIGIRRK